VNRRFEDMWREARAKFEPAFTRELGEAPSVRDVLEAAQAEGGPLWSLASDIYKRPTGKDLTEGEVRSFLDRCPPIRAVFLSTCVAQYHWAIKDRREESRYKAGRLDLFMAAYLPYCDRFVTKDPGQYNALTLIAETIDVPTKVCAYSEFREAWLLAA
jgi:hypothetical protein